MTDWQHQRPIIFGRTRMRALEAGIDSAKRTLQEVVISLESGDPPLTEAELLALVRLTIGELEITCPTPNQAAQF